ncbi:hypothetical protein HYU95_04150 [Candidatus Daviesbacteria bacterium]|nr:hypothetical protein [Candidatus Daviesbacteria bacterium]
MSNWKNNSDNSNALKKQGLLPNNQSHLLIGLFPLALSLAVTLTIITVLKFLPSKLPLFYSLPWGEGQLATHQQFLIIPASIVLITPLNLIISWQLHPSQSFLKKVLLVSSAVASLILTIALIKIILMFI